MYEIKNAIDCNNSRIIQTEDKISELEGMNFKITEENREKN